MTLYSRGPCRKNLCDPLKMCQKRRLRKDRGSRDGIKWEIAEAAGSVILGGLRSWQNYPPRRTTVSAHIRFWFPEKALTSYGYTVLPQTNTVTDPYISTGVCVCVCPHMHSAPGDEALLLLMGLRPKAGVWVTWTQTHTCAHRLHEVSATLPQRVAMTLWWRTLSHSGGSY